MQSSEEIKTVLLFGQS